MWTVRGECSLVLFTWVEAVSVPGEHWLEPGNGERTTPL